MNACPLITRSRMPHTKRLKTSLWSGNLGMLLLIKKKYPLVTGFQANLLLLYQSNYPDAANCCDLHVDTPLVKVTIG